MDKGNPRFGRYIRDLRLDRRLTLERIEELSARFGVPISKTYLSRCEHGQTHPTLPRLEVLARLFKVRLGEMSERFELEQELERQPPAAQADGLDPEQAAERGIEAASGGETQGALVLFDLSRRMLPRSPRPASSGGRAPSELCGELRGAPPTIDLPESSLTAAEPSPAGGTALATTDPARLARARSRLCMAVLSASLGNHRLSKEEAEIVLCAEDLPEEIRLRAAVQLALACRRLRRAPLARMIVSDLLDRGDNLPAKILADAHLLMGGLDLDAAACRPALLHLRKSVSLYREIGAKLDLCRALLELGESYRRSGQVPEAMVRYQEALGLARAAEIKSLSAELLSLLGRGHFLLSNHAAALRHLFESNDIARQGDYFDVLFRNYFYLRAIATAQGDEFSRRTAERSLRVLLARCDPLAEEALQYRQEVLCKNARARAGSPGETAAGSNGDPGAGAADRAGGGGRAPDATEVSPKRKAGVGIVTPRGARERRSAH